jgi:3-dehydroquinate synthase
MAAPLDVRVNLAERGYDIRITTGDPAGVGPFARERARGGRAFVVTDTNVAAHARAAGEALAAAGFQVTLAELPPGEAQKALAVASRLYDRLLEVGADRRTLVAAVGGGVVGDLAGFVAATFARGLPLLMVPTTLLAMVDSSVGGKVGVNHPRAKNMIGTFHQPVGVWIDTAVLATLPDREYRSGLAEVVKYGVIQDPELFAYLEANAEAILAREPVAVRHIVARCCRLKADVVEKDEREETGLRMILNYGHTFAHAFEAVGGYGAWLHGEAVAAGMVCAGRLAERRGLIPAEVTARQARLLSRFGLPTAPGHWPVEDLLRAMRADKKALAGRLRFILPLRLGEVALFDDVPEDEVADILEDDEAWHRLAAEQFLGGYDEGDAIYDNPPG